MISNQSSSLVFILLLSIYCNLPNTKELNDIINVIVIMKNSMQLGPQLVNSCLILTSQTCVLAELQESLDAAAGTVQAAAVRHLHGALLAQLAIAAQ